MYYHPLNQRRIYFQKAKALTINDFTFLTLKTSKMIREDKNDSYMYVYDSDQYREGIMVMPVEAEDIQHPEKNFPESCTQYYSN